MEYRTFAKTGKKISLLGFGCMRLPIVGENQEIVDIELGSRMVDYALARGVNYFDTAYMYHGGNSEPFIGQALSKYPRQSFNLASKLPPWMVEKPGDLDRIFAEQLNKCQVDYFDYYLLHNVSRSKLENIRQNGIIEQLNRKRSQGLIRNLGFSFHDRPPILEIVLKENDWDFVQIQLNYFDWELQDASQLYDILAANKLQVIIMEPVRGGMLATLSPEAAGIFKKASPEASLASWAIRFAASLPQVLTVLSGMTSLEQVEDNVATMEKFVPLKSAERQTIEQALAAYRKSATIPCTACHYCADCPAGLDIAKIFAIYNELRSGSVNNLTFLLHLGVLGEERHPRNCLQCGQCLAKCPQQLAIPELIASINQTIEQLAQIDLPPGLRV
jgi:predicted aldo/keto reductase-like oxidoreductase